VNAPVGSRGELVANSIRIARRVKTPTRLNSSVASSRRRRCVLGLILYVVREWQRCFLLSLLPPSDGIAIRRVCWLVRSFVRSLTSGHWPEVGQAYEHWRADTGALH